MKEKPIFNNFVKFEIINKRKLTYKYVVSVLKIYYINYMIDIIT